MTKITESAIELLAIKRLESLGYHYLYGPDIAPDASTGSATGVASEDIRDSFEQVLLLSRLQSAVKKINPEIPAEAQNEAIKTLQRIASPELLANNETFHRLLTEGIPVTKRLQGDDRGDRVWLIDFNQPHRNEFLVVNQFTVVANNQNKRPDILLFVNGLPLVVIELKNAADENATLHSAFRQ
ncbi:MAG: type I restriction endonuclease, partial [Bacteroidetes bacterium]|nr:type I restriction endonuclease [Bacteroidota bacterium]